MTDSEIERPSSRHAVVTGRDLARIAAYLPENYEVIPATLTTTPDGLQRVGIRGVDDHGWTLHDYVIPRLASGGYGCQEVGGIEGIRERTTGVMD